MKYSVVELLVIKFDKIFNFRTVEYFIVQSNLLIMNSGYDVNFHIMVLYFLGKYLLTLCI